MILISIEKGPAPAVLATGAGARATAKLLAAYASGQREFEFADHYRHQSVKTALFRIQHDKCAFCESKYRHVGYGGIEHYRPKGGFIQKDGDKLTQPGYYWLAYDWSNLFASCQLCNEKFKKNWFPLANPKDRVRSHKVSIAHEKPLLLRPDEPDLALHLGYREEVPYAVNGSKRGAATISILGLERRELTQHRAERLRKVKVIAETIRLSNAAPHLTPELKKNVAVLRRVLEEDRLPDAEYAMMVQAATADLFP